ncbi:LysM [Glarea lozoyensis ATCC 20868]|uniref:LysM n=1 Tax=Glarea lozoyensis (strain ATCC 20868 / MF5171) TaxID=1116229 RepID=S3CR42_GLAL2|nr:LysM [Glarea lozoyensis ATCC 20868]EPE27579.1 LysM [Glarea lozoyensis ATCC 20868]
MSFKSLLIIVLLALLTNNAGGIKIFPSPGALPAQIPAACRASLSTNIACGPTLVLPHDIEREVGFDDEFLKEYCNSTCTTSIQTWTTAVNARCGNTQYSFPGNVSRSGSDFAIPFQWAHNSVCAKGGPASEFCYPDAVNQTLKVCDDCALKYFAAMLNSTYGARKMSETRFRSLVSSCGASPTKYPYSTASVVTAPPTTITDPARRCSGSEYVVGGGDSCESIAARNGLAIDRFLADNSIDFKCSSLTAGSSVCIQDSCKLHTIQKGETCKQIVAGKAYTTNELVAWNPILETGCENTTALEGRTICITPPGTDNYDLQVTATFSWTWTVPSGQWVPGPTQGSPLGNSTTNLQFVMPTTTMTRGSGPDPTAYFLNCPIKGQDYDNGFDWEMINKPLTIMIDVAPQILGVRLSMEKAQDYTSRVVIL